MGKYLIYTIAVFLFSSRNLNTCSSIPEERIRAIHVNYDLPAVVPDSAMININNYYDVYYFRDLILYRSNYRFDSLIDGKLVFKEYRNFYFLFGRDSSYGYKIDINPHPVYSTTRQLVDSTLKHISLKSAVYDSFLNKKPDSIYFDKDKDLIKVFLKEPTKQNPEKITLYFYYSSKLKDIPETFSRMDNLWNMKLFKIRVLFGGGYYEQFSYDFPRRELVLDMKEINVLNKDEVLLLYERYKKRSL